MVACSEPKIKKSISVNVKRMMFYKMFTAELI